MVSNAPEIISPSQSNTGYPPSGAKGPRPLHALDTNANARFAYDLRDDLPQELRRQDTKKKPNEDHYRSGELQLPVFAV
jgi:hypothetical protein